MNIINELSNKRVVITSHFLTSIPVIDLADFLKSEVRELILICHPFFFNKDIGSSFIKYREGNIVEEKRVQYSKKLPEVLLYLKSLLLTLKWLFGIPDNDIFIGLGNLNAFSGIILKKVKRVKIVVFYAIDFVPQRFPNRWMNRVYHWLDNYVIREADTIWNLSPVMTEMREKEGISPKYRSKQITVPIGTNINARQKGFDQIQKNTIGFIGHLRKYQGLELLIDCLSIIKKKIPNIKLILIGDGPLKQTLEEKAKVLQVDSNIEFAGFIEDTSKAEEKLSLCSLAVAPYEDTAGCFVRYTDPGKIKTYTAVGLPVIITKVPQVAWEIEKEKCGIAINYNQEEFVNAIVKLLSDEALLKEYRDNAIKFGAKYSWDKVFSQAFESTPY